MTGFGTPLYKELLCLWKVATQTVAAPVLTAVLYLLIFGHLLEDHVQVYQCDKYTTFLVPGLVMMSVLRNTFANSSSSLIQPNIIGNLVFVLLTPLSHWEMFDAYVLAAAVLGLVVGAGLSLVTAWFADMSFIAPWWIVIFAALGVALVGTIGLTAGIWAEVLGQLTDFPNFLIMPSTFLSGIFYSVHSLPPFWQSVSHLNPFFYMIDGFPYGFFRHSDVDPLASCAVVTFFLLLLAGIAVSLLRSGYKLRH